MILDAFASQRLIEPLSDGDPSLDEDGAYAIAWELHARRLRRGEKPVGRKIGFTNRTVWAEYQASGPIWGHVYDSTVLSAPTGEVTLAVGHLLQPRIEPEIQLHFARTPPLTRDEGAILDCIDWIAHGFEIVQSPFPDWRFRAVDTIAASALHGALVVGPPVAVAEIEDCAAKLRSFTVGLSRNGVQQAMGGGANVLDSPLLTFAYLGRGACAAVPLRARSGRRNRLDRLADGAPARGTGRNVEHDTRRHQPPGLVGLARVVRLPKGFAVSPSETTLTARRTSRSSRRRLWLGSSSAAEVWSGLTSTDATAARVYVLRARDSVESPLARDAVQDVRSSILELDPRAGNEILDRLRDEHLACARCGSDPGADRDGQARDLPVGVVSAIAGQSRYSLTFFGEAAHAGTTPMDRRKDALAGAAEFVLQVEAEARATDGLVATVGQLAVSPEASNVVPGQAVLSLDVRHADDKVRLERSDRLLQRARDIAARRGLSVESEPVAENKSVPCSPRLASLLTQAVQEVGHPAMTLGSGAGHDAVVMAGLTDVAMLFVRCKGGISHNPAESVTEEDVAVAIDVVGKFMELLPASS